MENACEQMLAYLKNRQNLHLTRKTHPFITLSFAQSLDGCLAEKSGHATSLSCNKSLEMTHRLRALHDGILVGIDTVLSDNPKLTVRLTSGSDPRPIVLDTRLRLPLDCHLLDPARNSIIVTTQNADRKKLHELENRGTKIILVPQANGGVSLADLMPILWQEKIYSIMVEGGGRIISSFLQQRLFHFLVITIAPRLIGTSNAVRYQVDTAFTEFMKTADRFSLGNDMIFWSDPLMTESKPSLNRPMVRI